MKVYVRNFICVSCHDNELWIFLEYIVNCLTDYSLICNALGNSKDGIDLRQTTFVKIIMMNKQVSDVVAQVLKDDLSSRECDNRLVALVCRRLGHDLTQEQLELIGSLPNFASIVRSRARIQAAGRFRPRSEVWEQRRSHRRKT